MRYEGVVLQKQLIGVCGPVGSGKTAFLTSIIGHVRFTGERGRGGLSGA